MEISVDVSYSTIGLASNFHNCDCNERNAGVINHAACDLHVLGIESRSRGQHKQGRH